MEGRIPAKIQSYGEKYYPPCELQPGFDPNITQRKLGCGPEVVGNVQALGVVADSVIIGQIVSGAAPQESSSRLRLIVGREAGKCIEAHSPPAPCFHPRV
ncbi:unnamed protein product [Nezara viridula]|uniref:Uncharacterized protein n=1 Tax=Nezara viridula TaxID=85310 RepID=A0A9P0EFI7_NEZVI|nr:unnamed protein product [Nezara viridula]